MILELILVALGAYLIGSIPFGLLLTKAAGLGDIRSIGSGNIGATNVLRTGNKKLAVLTLFLDGFKGFLAVWLTSFLTPLNIYKLFGYIPDGSFHSDASFGLRFLGQPHLLYCAALFVVIGHCYPVWLKFKGGKGVATLLGAWLGLSIFNYLFAEGVGLLIENGVKLLPLQYGLLVGFLPMMIWLIAAITTKRSSLSAIVSITFSTILFMLDKIGFVVVLTMHMSKPIPVAGGVIPATQFNLYDVAIHSLHYATVYSFPIWIMSGVVIYRHKDNIKRLLASTEPKIGQKK